MKIQIGFGALVPRLSEQLGLPRRKLRYLQESADSIVTLSVGGFITEAQTRAARKRLMRRILKTFGKELAEKGGLR